MSSSKTPQTFLPEQTLVLPEPPDAERTVALGMATGSVGGSPAVAGQAPSAKPVWKRYHALPGGPDRRTVPGCTLEAVLGNGGMGAVYVARQISLGVTLRELAKHVASPSSDFTAICDMAAALDPSDRYENVEAMLADLRRFLDEKGYRYVYRESEEGHIWRNWRIYLSEFAPMLFR